MYFWDYILLCSFLFSPGELSLLLLLQLKISTKLFSHCGNGGRHDCHCPKYALLPVNSHPWALLCCPFKRYKRASLPGVLQSQESMCWQLFQYSDKNINHSLKCLNYFCLGMLPCPCSCRSYICAVYLQRGTCK